jgi:hypothetical protein
VERVSELCYVVMQRFASSVANWPKFRPQNTKVALKKYERPENSAADFFEDFTKSGKIVAELF